MASWWKLIAQQLGAGNARSHARRVAEVLGADATVGRSWAQKITNFVGAQREQGSWTKRAVPAIDLTAGAAARSLLLSGTLGEGGGASAPVNLGAPVIAGTPTVGETLTRTEGSWSGVPTLAGQWRGDGVTLDGETGATLVLSAEHEGLTIDYVETATNEAGADDAVSNELGPVAFAFSGAKVSKSVTQTGADYTSAVALTWDQEEYDTHGLHDDVNPTRLTVPAGWSRVRLYGRVGTQNASTATSIYAGFIKNGDIVGLGGIGDQRVAAANSVPGVCLASGPISVVEGDYFELALLVGGDTSIDVTDLSYFAMERVE